MAFYYCSALTSITIPSSVTSIGDYAFSSCTSLTSITIPNSVTSIGYKAFRDCTSLTSITIPSSVTSIGYSAFENTPWLTAKRNENSLVVAGSVLIDGTRLSGDVTIPSSVTSIGGSAFSGCTSLKSVTIPNSVTYIGDYAFSSCTSLTSITIPNSVTSIGDMVFNDCKSLTSITIPSSVTSIGNMAFAGCTSLIDVSYLGVNDTFFDTGYVFDDAVSEVKVPCNYANEVFCFKPVNRMPHDFKDEVFTPTETSLGGTLHKCSRCEEKYWTDLGRGNMPAQTCMPNGETVYHYCTNNNLSAKTTVDVGDGQTLTVFLQDPLGVLKKNGTDKLDIVVTYIKEGSARYNELMSQVDDDYPIEHINFFEVYPTVNGKKIEGKLSDYVYMEYEIPEGWDESDLKMILVQDGDDQELTGKVLEIDNKKYFAMWKNHFSSYAMIDELTDEEKAALAAKTGDNSRNMVLASSAMLIITGLFLEVCMKRKKFFCN